MEQLPHRRRTLTAACRLPAGSLARRGRGIEALDRRDRLAVAAPGRGPRRPSARPTRPTRLSGSGAARARRAAGRRPCRAAARTGPGSGSSRSSGRAGARARSRASRARHSAALMPGSETIRVGRAGCRSRGCARARRTRRSGRSRSARSARARRRRATAPTSLSGSAATRPVWRARVRNDAPSCPGVSLAADAALGRARLHRRAARRARRCWPSSPAGTSTGRARPPRRSRGRSCCCSRSPARCRCPASRAGRVAVAALAGLAVWSAVSLAWAPLVGPALDTVQRLLLYVAVLLAAVAVLRDPRAARAVEPVLALGRGRGDRLRAGRAAAARAWST